MLKQVARIALIVSFIFVAGLYFVTVRYQDGSYDMPFGESKIFYLYQNVGHHSYYAGGPFTSTYTRILKAEGCPCQGVVKPLVVVPLFFTWQFIANTILWFLPIFSITYIIKRHENHRN